MNRCLLQVCLTALLKIFHRSGLPLSTDMAQPYWAASSRLLIPSTLG
jgi:hypothetical protein